MGLARLLLVSIVAAQAAFVPRPSPTNKILDHFEDAASQIWSFFAPSPLPDSHSSRAPIPVDWKVNDHAFNHGVCAHWNVRRGFGFIETSNDRTSVFVHHADIDMPGFRRLAVGDAVQFRLSHHEQSGKVKAAQVTRIPDDNADLFDDDDIFEDVLDVDFGL